MEDIKETAEDRIRDRRNRKMMEDLPVLGRVVIEPEGIDLNLYKKIGEEVTRVVEHKPGQLYIKGNCTSQVWFERQHGTSSKRKEVR